MKKITDLILIIIFLGTLISCEKDSVCDIKDGSKDSTAVIEKINLIPYECSDTNSIGDHFWGYIDTTTDVAVVGCKYLGAWHFSEGLAAVENKDYDWGFIDKTGKEVIDCKYLFVSDFYNGKAKVFLMGDYFYIDKTGKRIE